MKLDSEHEFHQGKSAMKEMMTQSNSQPTRLLVGTCNPSRVLFNVLACLLLLALLPVSAGAGGVDSPTINFSYAQNTLGTYDNPTGVVVDKSGVVTVADQLGLHGAENYYTEVTGSAVGALAVDGSENIFAFMGGTLVKFSPHCYSDSCATTLSSLSWNNNSLAVDTSDNVYITKYGNVYELLAPNYSTAIPLPALPAGTAIGGMAVDATGNIFATAQLNGAGVLYEYSAQFQSWENDTPNGLIDPDAVTIAPNGNLYVSDGAGAVYNTAGMNVPVGGGFPLGAFGVAVDPNGNVYVLCTTTLATPERWVALRLLPKAQAGWTLASGAVPARPAAITQPANSAR